MSWIDEQLAKMPLEAQIAQLIHVASWSNREESHEAEIIDLIQTYGIGGVIFFQGTPSRQAEMTNRFQEASKVPLFISIDGEWGLGMRLQETMSFPYQMTLGGIDDESLIEVMGRQIGQQCRRLGIHINFAPTVDINTEPTNPVIGFRSFGEDKHVVAEKAKAYMRGMQAEGVLAVMKHFPGHGDTAVDSHLAMPILTHDRQRLEEIELYPFRELTKAGVKAAMVGHLHVPALDDQPELPATLSRPIVTELLREEMGFEGLIFTDALNMKGVSARYKPGEVDRLALLAGNDVLLYVEDVPKAIEAIKEAVAQGNISEEEIGRRVRHQLEAKLWAGLDQWEPISQEGLLADLHSTEAILLNQQLADEAVTIVKNDDGFLPISPSENVALLALNTNEPPLFQQFLPHLSAFQLPANASDKDFELLMPQLFPFDKLIISLHGLSIKAPNRFGLTDQLIHRIARLCEHFPVGIVLLCNAYIMPYLAGIENARSVIMAYQESPETQQAAGKKIV